MMRNFAGGTQTAEGGSERDPVRALGHFLVAAKILGAPPGAEEYLRRELTPQEVEEAEELAAEWAPARH